MVCSVGNSASTVSPPTARWPICTPMPNQPAGRCPAGSRTGSARRCRPSPACRPAWASQTMRRASRPAIWTATTSCPSAVRSQMLLRSLSSLASAWSADRNWPRLVLHGDHLAATGARCTCASNSDRKMLMRGSGSVREVQLGRGHGLVDQAVTCPSAGATTTPGRLGGVRGWVPEERGAGARPRPGRRPVPSGCGRRAPRRASAPPTNGRPAG